MRKTTTAEKTSTVKTSEAPAKETVTKDEVTGTKKETVEKLVKKPIGRPRKKAVEMCIRDRTWIEKELENAQ